MPEIQTLLNLPIETLAVIAAGYLAYRIAYTGHDANHSTVDVLLLTSVFALIGKFAFTWAKPYCPSVVAALSAVILAGVGAAIWRKWLCDRVGHWLYKSGVNPSDRHRSAWDSVRLRSGFAPRHFMLVLDDGSRVMSDLTRFYAFKDGPALFGADGSVAMFVTSRQDAAGEKWEDAELTDSEGFNCMSYFPEKRIKEMRWYIGN